MRFPTDDSAEDNHSLASQESHYYNGYYNTAREDEGVDDDNDDRVDEAFSSGGTPPRVGKPKSGVNVMAELARQTQRKNLLAGEESSGNSYISGGDQGLEVIVYPSGQLLKGTDPDQPPSSTIGPALESALLGSLYYRDQLPQYVLARRRDIVDDSDRDDLFDPALEDDEVITATRGHQRETAAYGPMAAEEEKTEEESTGFFQGLMQTAADDFKLVGNVIKLALSS
jgi:hypothetical protein